MGILNRLKSIFKAKQKQENKQAKRTIKNLQMNDIVTLDLEEFMVIGKLIYGNEGYEWTSYHLKGDDRNIWLSYEKDDDLYIGVYEKSNIHSQPIEKAVTRKTISLEGVTYTLDENGTATILAKEGQVGAAVGQQVLYWEFENEDAQFDLVSIEKWGSDFETSKGYSINEYEISIIAGS